MKRKSYILFFTIVLVSVIFLTGCGFSKVMVDGGTLNPNSVKTVGNHTYLTINTKGTPEDNHEKILIALDAFEKTYPMLKITFWKIEKGDNYIHGLWIDHEPKTE